MFFRNTRANGFHLAAEGDISGQFDWKAAVSYCRAFGTPRIPAHDIKHNTSALAQVGWHGTAPNDEQYEIAMNELKAQLAEAEAM